MKIIKLTAENIKKLVAVEIEPNGSIVQISGRNGQGKTSVLDSIWWALAGAKHIQAAPIRNGATQARIRLDLGEIIVTRTFKREEGGEITTKLEVAGMAKGTPQALLDSLLDSLAFDPLKFARMDGKSQFDALRQFVPDIDFDKIAAAQSRDAADRKELNRKIKEERVIADQIIIPPKPPTERIDEAALVRSLTEAGKHNADIQMRLENRRQAEVAIRGKVDQGIELRRQAAELVARAENLDTEVDALHKKLAAASQLPEPTSTEEIEKSIANAKLHNATVASVERRAEKDKLLAKLAVEVKTVADRMDQREKDKQASIASARLPIESLTFGDGLVLLNGVPFEQASDAEQLRASCALAMAGNPNLRVLRVRDGSLLDEEGLMLLGKMAEERDYQVWIERVGSGQVGFVLEDGHIQAPPLRDGDIPA